MKDCCIWIQRHYEYQVSKSKYCAQYYEKDHNIFATIPSHKYFLKIIFIAEVSEYFPGWMLLLSYISLLKISVLKNHLFRNVLAIFKTEKDVDTFILKTYLTLAASCT